MGVRRPDHCGVPGSERKPQVSTFWTCALHLVILQRNHYVSSEVL